MALMTAYLQTTKNLQNFMNSLVSAKAPERFTNRFLEDLGFRSTNVLHAFHRERGILIPEVATPSLGRSTGSYCKQVGECYLFRVKLDFEKAKEYRKSYGAYLRHNQWNDIEVEVCMLI